MPIDYTGTSAGLFVRLGKLINAGKEHRVAQGTLVTHIEEAMGKYTATSVDRAEYLGALNGDRNMIADANGRNAQAAVRDAMERTIIEQVDTELTPGLEPAKTIDNALRRLSVDMAAQTQSIGTTLISFSAVTNASTTFDGTIVLAKNEKYSYGGAKGSSAASNDTALAETITARCVKDARDGSLILGNERFEVAGDNSVDRLDRRWPQGSGSFLQVNATCSDIDSSAAPGQNMLTNSGFERQDATPFPLDWTAGTGTIGTSLTGNNTAFRGSHSVMFTGNGTNARSIYQVMGTGPRARIRSNTCYVASARLRAETADVTTGIVRIALVDSGGNVLGGGVTSVARNMSSANVTTGAWAHLVGSFTTPLDLPSEVRFSIETDAGGSALANGAKLIIDEVILAPVYVLYGGGPGCVIVPGTANFELDDSMRVSVTKTQAEWHLELDRYLNLAARDIRFPTSASPTISTTLIA